MGIANTIASSSGFASPIVTGYLIDGQVYLNLIDGLNTNVTFRLSQFQQTIAAWQKVFFLGALFNAAGALLFIVLCTAEVQYYNDPEWREKKKLGEEDDRGETIKIGKILG